MAITDPAALALLQPTRNRFRVERTTDERTGDGFDVALGFVRVKVAGEQGIATECLFDGDIRNPTGTCADRNLCDAYSYQAVVDDDPDSDGLPFSCGNRRDVFNPDQADTDGDGIGNACAD